MKTNLRYQVERIGHANTVLDVRTVSRADSAHLILNRMVYDMLAGSGLLDRPIAIDLMHTASLLDVGPVEPGTWRVQTINLWQSAWPRVELTTHRLDLPL